MHYYRIDARQQFCSTDLFFLENRKRMRNLFMTCSRVIFQKPFRGQFSSLNKSLFFVRKWLADIQCIHKRKSARVTNLPLFKNHLLKSHYESLDGTFKDFEYKGKIGNRSRFLICNDCNCLAFTFDWIRNEVCC